MKKYLLVLSLVLQTIFLNAQSSPYFFTTIKDNAKGSVSDQCATSTCWSFATISFLESEIIRKGNPAVNLSEMINVRVLYPQKAESYVRYQGKQQFGPGGLGHDVINVVRDFGVVPERAYTGLEAGKVRHNHSGLDALLEGTVKTVVDKKVNRDNPKWIEGIEATLDKTLGSVPASFDYNGKNYTPASFRDALNIKADEYVSLTSFSHHPFYSSFVLEVPDNWAKGSFYNLPLDEMMQVMDNAIANGYTIAWDADASEKGFSFNRGLALVPADSVKRDAFFNVVTEKEITQENRQEAYETYETTDDHLMHITGNAKDQDGNIYYITKNSWGFNNPYKGYQYVSRAYVEYKTISIVVHRDAIPASIRTKLGI